MLIQALYFAVFRERLGRDREELQVPAGATVATAIAALEARHPAVAALRGRYRVALNQELIAGDPALAEGDELVLIPPVAGGSAPPPRRAVVLAEPLSLERVTAAVSHAGAGGVVTFTGAVRGHARGRVVTHLDYEAYVPMAEKVLAATAAEIEGELAGVRLAVEHRVGRLQVGEVAVVIAASAAHRAEAFTACQAMIDRLKDRAPIWKKEFAADGSEWVGLGP
ncbi:MAG: molybdenum cofactor biosynthesis protein MoaE [Kofleriaceae bacterium]|jgi:molybdopterin converting factor subunit 1|nr:molybdenum cofactor biosynthesis protein MoaE [Kofleriaceae bacterium]MBP6836108.1 molybdenum cofactor biosynthesis protein MoaE [Kofleriaceae bacterium]